MERTWKLTIAGMLMLIAGAAPLTVFSGWVGDLISHGVLTPREANIVLWLLMPFSIFGMAFAFSPSQELSQVFLALFLLGMLVTLTVLVVGIYTTICPFLPWRSRRIALAGGIAAFISSPLFGIPAVILAALCKKKTTSVE